MDKMCCERIARAYIDEPIKDIRKLEGGHINSSFLVLSSDRYVLQKLNPRLYADNPALLEHNYMQYKKACESYNGSWYCPEWLGNKEGMYFYTDEDGKIWRMYRYIPSDQDKKGSFIPKIHETGKGLGRLHRILSKCKDIKNIGTTARLHDLNYHYGKYLKEAGSKRNRIAALDGFIEDNLKDMLSVHVPEGSVIHGDAKFSNMILKDGKVAGFIDLDTIMQGSIYDDLADCARSCCLNDDGTVEEDMLMELISGYEEGADIVFCESEIMLQKRNLAKNMFTLGIRYYTDYLSGEGYFSEEYKGQSLNKAKRLLRGI